MNDNKVQELDDEALDNVGGGATLHRTVFKSGSDKPKMSTMVFHSNGTAPQAQKLRLINSTSGKNSPKEDGPQWV